MAVPQRKEPEEFAVRAVDAIERDQWLDDPGEPVPLEETSYYVGRLTVDALRRVATFHEALLNRAAMQTPSFSAHRALMESFVSDLHREIAKREAAGE